MASIQQEETKTYFENHALEWKQKAEGFAETQVNIIKQRNDFVLMIAEEKQGCLHMLDVGCGTGDLVCELATRGHNSVGVDFSKEMIRQANAKVRALDIRQACFEWCSIFEYPIETAAFDVISANGFIEYISPSEVQHFFQKVHLGLKPGGSFVLGSRNRLFNIGSFNQFTKGEIEQNTIIDLLEEAILIAGTQCVMDLLNIQPVPIQNIEKQENTGIDVGCRYQYTPAQLVQLLDHYGFEPVELYPVHIHGIPPMYKEKLPKTHCEISNYLQRNARGNLDLLPQASSFMLHVQKRDSNE